MQPQQPSGRAPLPVPGTAPRGLAFYAWLSRFKFMNYRGKIMTMAFVGTHIPLITLAVYFAVQTAPDMHTLITTIGVTLVATLVGTLITLVVLNMLLRPVVLTARTLRMYRESRLRSALPSVFTDEAGTLMADAGQTIDHLESTLETLEFVDEATGLPNRRRFLQAVAGRMQRGQKFGVVVLRFSNFSRIAENLDLRRADLAAAEIARRMAAAAESSEQMMRVSKSSFAWTVNVRKDDSPNWVDASARLRRLIAACAEDLRMDGLEIKPALHGGMAAYPEDAEEPEQLLDLAVAAASQANDASPVMLHSPEARAAALARFKIEQELRRAIDQNEFELHYQPVVDLGAGQAIGAEALIRWRHPERGMVPPGMFIPAAESSGLIEPIGLWVLRRACAQLREWKESGRPNMRIAINLSARQFLDPNLRRHVLEAVDEAGISADQLEIELTETAAMVDHEHTRRVFTTLRDAGVGIAIDDFGTGYASMSYLRKLPFDKLKIDREFVTDVHRERQSQAICGALIELSKGLDLRVLAEGVEAEAEVRYLSERGCGLFQGFYFSKPLPAADFLKVIDSPSRFMLPANFERAAA